MKRFNISSLMIFIASMIMISSCGKEETDGIRNIFIEAQKSSVLLGIDTIKLNNIARDGELNIIEGVEVSYTVNGSPISDNCFIPPRKGDYQFMATYKGLESNIVNVNVASIEDEIERLKLEYIGNEYLTTNPWSNSGQFSAFAIINNRSFEVPFTEIELLVEGNMASSNQALYFSEAGEYDVKAKFVNIESNVVTLKVRKEINYPEVSIPIIFHTSGIDYPLDSYMRLLDTLNSAFSKSSYSSEKVRSGFINPNAVNCNVKFKFIQNNNKGVPLAIAGINRTDELQNPGDSVLTYDKFLSLEKEHNINPDSAVNIWIVNGRDFDFEPVNKNETQGSGGGRGLANTPVLADADLEGIPKLSSLFNSVDTTGISHSIILRAGSIFGSHPDFLVNRMAYHFGLFDTHAFGCSNDGDYCPDTLVPDLGASNSATSTLQSCSGFTYRPNNFMGLLSNKNNFTFDQRERMRFIMKHGLNRPGE